MKEQQASRRRTSQRATLSDVARAARVSVMTVSNFVRGKPVRASTRKSVAEAISRLNYRPNTSARNLRLAEERSVGIVIADSDPAFLNDPFISRLVSGLSNYLSSLDYTLDVQGVEPDRFESATILRKAGNAALCAILCGPKPLRRRHLANLQRLNQPVVVFQEVFQSPGPNVAMINQDDFSGGRQLGQHLLAKRPRSVLFIRPTLQWCAVERREMGLREALVQGSSGILFHTLLAPSERFEDVLQVVTESLRQATPDAIVAATDSMAVAALKACERAGIRVPDRLVVAGFNGFDAWQYTTPTLTTVVSPAYGLGRQAGEQLIARLKTGKFPKRTVTLPVQLQIGESTRGIGRSPA
ncbi:MAG TPA: LacI family DNA-binding transcriptional regulator [Steroidobacteraceae bacterium]|nr:LacI family DNA-binding transcriptional regulator [Steroidobacteraceae bacterium]